MCVAFISIFWSAYCWMTSNGRTKRSRIRSIFSLPLLPPSSPVSGNRRTISLENRYSSNSIFKFSVGVILGDIGGQFKFHLDNDIMLLRIKALKKHAVEQVFQLIRLSFTTRAWIAVRIPLIPRNILFNWLQPPQRNRPRIIEVQIFLVSPSGWPTANIGFTIKFQRVFVFQVGNGHGVVFEGRVLLELKCASFSITCPSFPGDGSFLFQQTRGQPGGHSCSQFCLKCAFEPYPLVISGLEW